MKAFIGRRKTSVCRIYELNNTIDKTVNKLEIQDYFKIKSLINRASMPLKICETDFGFMAIVKGGGKSSQSSAIQLALSRLLAEKDENFKKLLRSNKFLTVDSRQVERKKAGKIKARKAPQRSKR